MLAYLVLENMICFRHTPDNCSLLHNYIPFNKGFRSLFHKKKIHFQLETKCCSKSRYFCLGKLKQNETKNLIDVLFWFCFYIKTCGQKLLLIWFHVLMLIPVLLLARGYLLERKGRNFLSKLTISSLQDQQLLTLMTTVIIIISLTQISSLNSRFMYRKCSFCQTCHIFANYFTMFFQCFTILTSFNRRWSVDFWARQQRRSSRCTVYQWVSDSHIDNRYHSQQYEDL